MRRYKIGYVLYFLYVLHTCSVISEETIKRESDSKSQNTPVDIQRNDELPSTDKLRDKRALGLILSGLAQVFGYRVDPIQVASLPNPNPPTANGAATQTTVNLPQPPTLPARQSTPQNAAPTTPSSSQAAPTTPRPRETIRLTGILNFGNSSSLLSHLQQYESIFHSSTTPAPSTAKPLIDLRIPNTDLVQPAPLLVKIPLPIVPELPAPILANEDLTLSYPQPYAPVRKQQETVYRNNKNREHVSVEQKEIYDAKDVTVPSSKYTHNMYVEDPQWKKQYEDRLAELERKQEEQAKRLREQEANRNREKENSYEKEKEDDKYSSEEKETNSEDEKHDSGYRENENYKDDYSGEVEDSTGKYENEEKPRESVTNQYTKGEKEDEEDEEKYSSYENDNSYRPYKEYENPPQTTYSNYTSGPYNQQLPISDYYEHRRPEKLRNSYGEVLDSRELDGERIANYFEKFVHPQNDFYTSSKTHSAGSSKEEDDKANEDEDGSVERGGQEYFVPARNKYEEYDLVDNKNIEKSTNSDTSGEYRETDTIQQRPHTDNKLVNQIPSSPEFDFIKFAPYIVPARYLYAPDELEKEKARVSTFEKRDNDPPNNEVTTRTEFELFRKPEDEDLRPKLRLPQRISPKKLPESEEKGPQIRPAPFAYRLDSSEQTLALPTKSQGHRNIRISSAYQNPREVRKGNEGPLQRGIRVTPMNSGTPGRRRFPPENAYNNFREGVDSQRLPSRQPQRTANRIPNSVPLNYTQPRVSERLKVQIRRRNEKQPPNTLNRYKYTSNYNDENKETPDVEIVQAVQHELPDTSYSTKFESLKQTNYRTAPIAGNYYSRIQPDGNKETLKTRRENVENGKAFVQKTVPAATFDSPEGAHDFFGFSKDDYNINEQRGNEKSSGNVETNKKLTSNEELAGFTLPEPDPYQYDESLTKFTDEPESKNGKVKIREHANKISTVTVTEEKHDIPNPPIYLHFTRKL